MKSVLTLGFLFIMIFAQAGDTLTRAQVYNFNVGDTFDYRHYNHTVTFNPDPNPSDITTISYSRYVITSVFYPMDSNTRYIQRERLYPLPTRYDTLILNSITEYEVALEGASCSAPTTIISNSPYHGRIVNILGPNPSPCLGPSFFENVFGDGLGIVLSYGWGGAQIEGENYWDSLELIYYVKGSETWGAPYYDFPTGIQQMPSVVSEVALFPTLNDGTFNVEVTGANESACVFQAYDLTGREIKQLQLANDHNRISLQGYSAGIYIWRVVAASKTIGVGKLVIGELTPF